MPLRLISLAVFVLSASVACSAFAQSKVRLYTLDCGQITVTDANKFSDTQGYDGRTLDLPVPCYVITHDDKALLWDAGVAAHFANAGKKGVAIAWYTTRLDETLVEQLKRIEMRPDDIDFLAISHVHFDHMGQAASVPNAHLLIGAADFELLFSGQAPKAAFDPDLLRPWAESDNKTLIRGDHDVFGDGRVMILSAPGHTPGHQVLLVELENAGRVMLSGDLYHFKENRLHRRLPDFNTSRADTLASMDRIEAYLKNIGARLIIQHDRPTFDAMPKAPAYLD
jgi:glyoxylase-like metal-dependent hydrolase (beta-lactamase superfamily II)